MDPSFDLSVCILNITWVMMTGEKFAVGDPKAKWIIRSIETSLQLVEGSGFVNFVFPLQYLNILYNPYFCSFTFSLRLIATFCRPMSVEAGLGLFRRLYLFHQSIQRHHKHLDDDSERKDFIFNFLSKQKKHKEENNNEIDFMYSGNLLLILKKHSLKREFLLQIVNVGGF